MAARASVFKVPAFRDPVLGVLVPVIDYTMFLMIMWEILFQNKCLDFKLHAMSTAARDEAKLDPSSSLLNFW